MTAVFKPQKNVPKKLVRNIKIELSPESYQAIADLAKDHGVSLKEFVKQAVAFAVENIEKP